GGYVSERGDGGLLGGGVRKLRVGTLLQLLCEKACNDRRRGHVGHRRLGGGRSSAPAAEFMLPAAPPVRAREPWIQLSVDQYSSCAWPRPDGTDRGDCREKTLDGTRIHPPVGRDQGVAVADREMLGTQRVLDVRSRLDRGSG